MIYVEIKKIKSFHLTTRNISNKEKAFLKSKKTAI